MAEYESDDIIKLKGVGPAVAAKLTRLGIKRSMDLLELYPRRYEDRNNIKKISQLQDGEDAAFEAEVIRGETLWPKGRRRFSISRIFVKDETGKACLVWFNQPYRVKRWTAGSRVCIFGRIKRTVFGVELNSPEIDEQDQDVINSSGGLVPVYPSTEGVSQRLLRNLTLQSLSVHRSKPDSLPVHIRLANNLVDFGEAVHSIHFPKDWKQLSFARRRLIFEEFFLFECAIHYMRKQRIQNTNAIVHSGDGILLHQVKMDLPFQLTGDQEQSLSEIKADMESASPMHRLLQGDVGSGKTAVAMLALVKTVENKCQGVLMTPTEILAEQHWQTFNKLLAPQGLRIGLLTGRITGNERKKLLAELAEGQLDILIGTHALLGPTVIFNRLGLAVTDEQHRFGVNQRIQLRSKGESPHVLVMSATPIPRTVALTIYGELDCSVIRQMPPGRLPVSTHARSRDKREKVYHFVLEEVRAGRQAFVVCPLIEGGDTADVSAAVELFDELQENFLLGIPCGLLHGRLKAEEKEQVMKRFAGGEIKVLITTTVIEVGIDVPNASVMVIEDAERFGLAQLHQLRGRVGRGGHRSWCILLHSGEADIPPERLKAMVEISDGFVLAEKDLVMRGPGQFFGYRQHGLPEFKLASLADDLSLLETARNAAMKALADPSDSLSIMAALENRYSEFFGFHFTG